MANAMSKNTGTFTMGIRNGLHLRPAQQLTDLAMSFKAAITLRKGDRAVDAKSIFDIITLGATCGSTILIEAEGDDAPEAIRALGEFLEKPEETEPPGEA